MNNQATKGIYEVFTTDHRGTGITTEANNYEEANEILNPNEDEYIYLVKA